VSLSFKVVIPARYGATRLPGKPLRMLADKPLVQHVHERALDSGAEEVVVATDDPRIAAAVEGFGGEAALTAADHPSGTDRVAEVARSRGWPEQTIVVNLQGDEPLMPPALVRQVAGDLAAHSDAGVATLCALLETTAELFDPHVVKVVMDAAGYALYFSRAPIPWDRDAFAVTTEALPRGLQHFRHIGLYAYRCGFLSRYAELEPCALEHTESLEQLRALWHGVRIHVGEAGELPGQGIDTEQDLERVAALLAAAGGRD